MDSMIYSFEIVEIKRPDASPMSGGDGTTGGTLCVRAARGAGTASVFVQFRSAAISPFFAY